MPITNSIAGKLNSYNALLISANDKAYLSLFGLASLVIICFIDIE
jgi:hypothetical protein